MELVKKTPTTVQTLIFDSSKFDRSAATKWASEHGFHATKVDETEGSFRLRQLDPADFADASFKTIELANGVKAVIGHRKRDEQEAEDAAKAEAGPAAPTLRPGVTATKNADGSTDLEISVLFGKVDEDERLVYGIVYEPDVVDAQGDSASAAEIRKACHNFMIHSRKIGLMHKDDVSDKTAIVENYVAPVDMYVGNQRVHKGTWVIVTKVNDDAIWGDVKTGKLTGYSMHGKAVGSAN